jgi:alpha-maltose-1-phosphate synthase
MENKEVLMAVCNFFNPDNRVYRAANTLQENGFNVKLLAYHKRGLRQNEVLGFGFNLLRIPYKNKKFVNSKVNGLLRYYFFKKECKKIANKIKPSVVHCHDYNTLFLGIYCKKKFGSKIVYDNHEYFQDLNYIHRYPMFVRKKIAKFERNALEKYVDELIVVSPGIKNLYSKIFNGSISIIRNIPEVKYSNLEVKISSNLLHFLNEQKAKSKKILLYLGTNSQKGRGFAFLEELLPKLNSDFSLLVCGAKSEEETALLQATFATIPNRFFTEKSLNYAELVEVSKYCFAGLSLIEPIYISYNHSLPNKLFEYISLNLPVIVSEIPDQKAFVEEQQVGISIPFDLNVAKTKIEEMKTNFSFIQKAKKEVNWEIEKELYLKIYAEL